jgi:nitroimidazol reductase NimA-like FMN-containing flavoprotein (pyridoxamine 5'-phosphate oxidase superfamily)
MTVRRSRGMSIDTRITESRRIETRQSTIIPPEVVEYLGLHHVLTLSTSSFTGMPHADTVVFCNDTQQLYFFLIEGTPVMRNIADSPYVSFTIDDYAVNWRKVRELHGVGRCRRLGAAEDALAMAAYRAKFGPDFVRPPGVAYRVAPSEMHFVDYDYDTVNALLSPGTYSRVYQIEGASAPPAEGPVSTSLARTTYEPGEIVFAPGAAVGAYYVVVSGEVEIRGEGHGVDQTVIRLGSGKFFGDQASLRGQRGALTCHALQRTVLLAVDPDAIRDLVRPPGAD